MIFSTAIGAKPSFYMKFIAIHPPKSWHNNSFLGSVDETGTGVDGLFWSNKPELKFQTLKVNKVQTQLNLWVFDVLKGLIKKHWL